MYERFTARAKKVMQLAQEEARRFHHDAVGTEHMLLGIVREGSGVAASVLKTMGIDLGSLASEVETLMKPDPSIATTDPRLFTAPLTKAIDLAVEEASNLGHSYIGTEHLLLGLVKEGECASAQILVGLGAMLHDIRENVLEFIRADSGDDDDDDDEDEPTEDSIDVLLTVSYDFTGYARFRGMPGVVGREAEIERLIQILAARAHSGVALVGQTGVGKSAILRGLAQRIDADEVPKCLHKHRVLRIDLGSLGSVRPFPDRLESVCRAIASELRQGPRVLIVIEPEWIVGYDSGSAAMDHASRVLLAELVQCGVQCLCEATSEEYERAVRSDKSVARLFQRIDIEAPNRAQTLAILLAWRDRLEAHHGVRYTDSALAAAAATYVSRDNGLVQPDKAIELIDEAGARAQSRGVVEVDADAILAIEATFTCMNS